MTETPELCKQYPWRLEIRYRTDGSTLEVALAFIAPWERMVIRAKTREQLQELITRNNFETHPRLISLTITGLNSFEEKKPGKDWTKVST